MATIRPRTRQKTADAERLLQGMIQACKAGYLEDAPSVVAYNCAMHAGTNSGESGRTLPFVLSRSFHHMMDLVLCACGNQGKTKGNRTLVEIKARFVRCEKTRGAAQHCILPSLRSRCILARSGNRVWTRPCCLACRIVSEQKE